jgi:hypothetical protein
VITRTHNRLSTPVQVGAITPGLPRPDYRRGRVRTRNGGGHTDYPEYEVYESEEAYLA